MKIISVSLLLVASIFFLPAASMAVVFQWICDNPTCNGDSSFSAFLNLSPTAVALGDFVGVAGNILSAGVTSGVGNGFTLSLSNMLTGPPGSNEDDVSNIRIVLNAAKTEITQLVDITAGTDITFFDGGVGRVDFLENVGSDPYFVQSVQDLNPAPILLLGISGRFVRLLAVPEPSTLLLLGAGLAGLVGVGARCRRNRERRARIDTPA